MHLSSPQPIQFAFPRRLAALVEGAPATHVCHPGYQKMTLSLQRTTCLCSTSAPCLCAASCGPMKPSTNLSVCNVDSTFCAFCPSSDCVYDGHWKTIQRSLVRWTACWAFAYVPSGCRIPFSLSADPDVPVTPPIL